jgi:hypothetical protein
MVKITDISPDILDPLLYKLVMGAGHRYVSERNVRDAAKIAPVCKSFHAVVAKIPRLVEIFAKRHVKRLPKYFSAERNKNAGSNKIVVELKPDDHDCPCLCVKVINDVLLFAPGVNRLHLHGWCCSFYPFFLALSLTRWLGRAGLELPYTTITKLSEGLKSFPFLHVLCLSKW